MGRLVVLGTIVDPHVRKVVAAVRAAGFETQILDYKTDALITTSFPSLSHPSIAIEHVAIAPDDVVWERHKILPFSAFYFQDELPDETPQQRMRRHSLRAREWRALYRYLALTYSDQALNYPIYTTELYKPTQQVVAANLGLSVPPSIITNDRKAVLKFAEYHPELIIKSLGSGLMLRADGGAGFEIITTMDFSLTDVEKSQDEAFAACPHFIQAKIPKAYELRVFAVGDRYKAAAIDSQSRESTKLDWRMDSRNLSFQMTELPANIAEALARFLRHFSLTYGSFDLIVTPDEEYVFLECNPDGQWGFLESDDNPALSQLLADAIVERLREPTDLPVSASAGVSV